jgi:hypothetical protein
MDGDLDIITGNLSGDIRFFENTGTNWVENPTPVQGLSGGQNATPALADLDADGDPDLTLGNYDGTFDYFKNNAIVTSSGEPTEKISSISLSVSPNPFATSTVIHFELASSTDVSFQVISICGKVLYSGNRENMAPGNHSQIWNGGAQNPGVYFIRLITDENAETIKVIKQ